MRSRERHLALLELRTRVDKNPDRFPVDLLREWKANAERGADEALGKTAQGRVEEMPEEMPEEIPEEISAVPRLSEKLRVPRPKPDPETEALDLLLKHFQAHMRVVHLIDAIGHLPNNSVTNINRGPAYDEARRALLVKFGEDYFDFQQDMERAVTLLEAVRDNYTEAGERQALDDIISAARISGRG